MRQLHSDIEEKARRIKELDTLLNQEKDRCREFETKLKVILELRERDAHLHIRQLGQSDAELRKARTDTERVRILQQQLELKQYGDAVERFGLFLRVNFLGNNWTTYRKYWRLIRRSSARNVVNCNTRHMRNGWKSNG